MGKCSKWKGDVIRNDYSVLSDWGQETNGMKNHISSSFTLTCSYYYMLRVMSGVATALGHDDDALLWSSKASDVKSAFNRKFFHDGVYEFGNQANYGMALFYGLVDSAYVKSVAKTLAETVMSSDYSIKAGESGLRPILMALSDNGYNDVVYCIAKKTTFPSYDYWLKCGATTSLEYWDLSLSQNHCMMDHIEEWFYGKLGGISDLGDAYLQLRLSPWIPSDMASADVKLQSPRGMVRVSWNRTAESTEYLLSVPIGSTAEVCLPVLKGERLMESGHDLNEIASVSNVEYTDSLVTFILGSGDYRFTMNGSMLSSQDK